MSDFTSPPRGRGRHWSDGREPTRYERGVASTDSGFLPRIDDPYPAEDDDVVTSNPGLYRVDYPGGRPAQRPSPTRPIGPDISQDDLQVIRGVRASVPVKERPADLVVPRVYLEPDEAMDKLRQRAARWAIARDVTAVIVGGYLIFRWMLYPLYLLIAGG